jgi:phosphocarrier protein HPr
MSDAVIHRRTVTVINEQGLHFRPCQLIALAAQQHPGPVVLVRGSVRADAKSLLELLTLAAEHGTELELEVAGPNATIVIDKVAELFAGGFQIPPRVAT